MSNRLSVPIADASHFGECHLDQYGALSDIGINRKVKADIFAICVFYWHALFGDERLIIAIALTILAFAICLRIGVSFRFRSIADAGF